MRFLRHTFTITRRELGELFGAPTFWVVAGLFHLLTGSFFVQLVAEMMEHVQDPYKRSAFRGELNLSEFVLRNVFDITNTLLLVIIPILTMRLIAEERRSGMFELLVATPIRDGSLLAGKWLAVWMASLALVASAAVYALMASRLGAVEWGLVTASLIGLALLAAAYASFGLFASTLTDQPVVAAVASLSGLLLFAFLGYMGPSDSGLLANAMRGFSFSVRTREFFSGMLRGEDVLFMLCFTGFFLFASARVLEARRWRL